MFHITYLSCTGMVSERFQSYLVGGYQYVRTGSLTSSRHLFSVVYHKGPFSVPFSFCCTPPISFHWSRVTVFTLICTPTTPRYMDPVNRRRHWSCRTPSPTASTMLLLRCILTDFSWIQWRLRSCGLPPADALASFHSPLFVSAPMKSCQPPLSTTSAYTSIPMSPWGHRSRRQSPRASSYCVSCDLFAGLFPDPSSRPWWRLSSWRVWTLGTPLSPAFHSTSWNDSSQWWTPPPSWCSLRGNSTTSRRSCASYTGWRCQSESTTSWLSLSTNVSMD